MTNEDKYAGRDYELEKWLDDDDFNEWAAERAQDALSKGKTPDPVDFNALNALLNRNAIENFEDAAVKKMFPGLDIEGGSK
jgi:hypothetical protein